jgi:hypothetical protein
LVKKNFPLHGTLTAVEHCILLWGLMVCHYCENRELDDEFHVLNICAFLQDLRVQFLPAAEPTRYSFTP